MTIGEFVARALYGGCIASSPGEPLFENGAHQDMEAYVVWFWATFYAYRPSRAGRA